MNSPARVLFRVFLCLFILLFRTATAVTGDEYTLPKNDPCHDTLEGYKKYMAPRVDDLIQVSYYQKNAKAIQEWLKCCPGGKKMADGFRPKFPGTERPLSVIYIPVPSLFDTNIPCAKVIYSQKGFFSIPAKGDQWLMHYRDESDAYWKQLYFTVANQLHDCCMYKLRAPQPLSESNQPAEQETENAQLMRALVAYEYQLASVQKERDQYKQQAQHADEICLGRVKQITDERDSTIHSLNNQLEQIAPYSGMNALAAFPAGAATSALVFYGSLALLAGYFLAVPGHTRWWTKVIYGEVGALLALLVFVITVAFLPDTRTSHFLLALLVAILFSILRAWIRIRIAYRASGPAPVP